MTTAPESPPSDAAAWARLVERLESQRDLLVDDFLERVAQLGAYGDHIVPSDDLRATAIETLDMLIRKIAGVPLTAKQIELPRRLGVRRARQGIARESLLEAVRLDFRVLWSGLVRANDGKSGELIVLHAEELLTIVEQYIGDVQVAFLDEQAALAHDSQIEVSRAFARLLNAQGDVEDIAVSVAGRLGVAVNAVFEIAVIPAALFAGARDELELRERGRLLLSSEFDDAVVLVREQRQDSSWSQSLPAIRGGLVRGVVGLGSVPHGVRAARSIAQHSTGSQDTLRTEEDVWPVLAHDAVSGTMPELVRIATALDHILDGERARLLETFADFTRTGSLKQTALNLFCHRNTVVNRLNAFERATGLDPTRPADAARGLIAFGPEVARAWARGNLSGR
ncbi:helix-turn-helix domain-containing protein [Cryobacterium sp. PH29-G1]|uniref:helix-turn-helix domain-containing protein n=1 Tax=Cryobacterium sp. PH29-G1 TaxID=3046211 RepID=UPI0024B9A20B|nr:helix-turn-helix domain-containing protein [Cryobacterium sp. PH29-G1]MDJ0348373.1 helix-turn-helix domain-containing protein [Cryobacterium sp. PH29-G1]